MKKIVSVDEIKQEIDSYAQHFTGAPLLVGVDNTNDYTVILGLLKDDYSKQVVFISDSCEKDYPPDPTYQISSVSNAAKCKPVIWIGAAQSIMFYGQQETEHFFINLLGHNFNGPVTVICPFCCSILERIGNKYKKHGNNILLMKNEELILPKIHLSPKDFPIAGVKTVHGIKKTLQILEEGKITKDINVVTSCNPTTLSNSMYTITEGLSAYQIICQVEPGISANTDEFNGTQKQWEDLAFELSRGKDLASLCKEKLCSVQNLSHDFVDYLSSDQKTRFLCFICLKVFWGNNGDYLSFCLSKANTSDELEDCLYTSILDINHEDKDFSSWFRQRSRILSSIDENTSRMKAFCEQATIKGRDVLWYLRDETEEERAALIHALCCYPYTPEEVIKALKVVSPQLFAYMQPFVFDEFNTKVMDADEYVRNLLSDYFQKYKLQKLTNHQDADFVKLVEEEAKTRSFTKLQARSAIVTRLDRKNSRPYFFDALGVEFLSFIQSKAEEYGMQFECLIGHCNLPSITSKNKEFYNSFPEGSILKEEGLDEIKHHGTKYDFQLTTEPLHIFDELKILDKDLRKMGSILASGQCQKIIILSDHGASRLAVTYQSENDKLVLDEPGKHSGRCCPSEVDPAIDYVSFEDGFAVLANYERFKGSRKADVEAHGGATLEETVVPVIVLTLKPKEQKVFFVDPVVICSIKDGSSIRLFANPPLKKPRLVLGDQSYDGIFDGDKHNVVFNMPDIRRRGQHEADIYDGGIKISTLTFETKRQTGTNQLI